VKDTETIAETVFREQTGRITASLIRLAGRKSKIAEAPRKRTLPSDINSGGKA
jgi:hypothetical protein